MALTANKAVNTAAAKIDASKKLSLTYTPTCLLQQHQIFTGQQCILQLHQKLPTAALPQS